MKRIISLMALALLMQPVFSQLVNERNGRNYNNRNEVRTIFGPHAGNGGYAAITMGYTQVDGRNGLLMGGRGEWIVGHGLGLGVGGYGFVGDPQFNTNENLYYSLAGGYGGFIFEPIIMGRWPIHVSFPVLIGAGGVALTSFGEDALIQLDNHDAYFIEASAFFVAEPGVELELNLVRWMRLAFFGSYRYTTDIISTGNINENALNSWSAGITLKVGRF